MKTYRIGFLIFITIFIVGCASSSGPRTSVGIINGKYAMQTIVPNNNKGKKVNLVPGQSYSCGAAFVNKSGKKDKMTFDLKTSSDGKIISLYNVKFNGKPHSGYGVSKFVYKPGLGFVEKGKRNEVLMVTSNNTGSISIFPMKDAKKIQKIQKNQLPKSTKIQGGSYICTQTTNNSYTNTRYMTPSEIDFYKHNQQIAVQQRAIDSANYNAAMANLQLQTAQMNYNTQQMLNRMNTYRVNVYHY